MSRYWDFKAQELVCLPRITFYIVSLQISRSELNIFQKTLITFIKQNNCHTNPCDTVSTLNLSFPLSTQTCALVWNTYIFGEETCLQNVSSLTKSGTFQSNKRVRLVGYLIRKRGWSPSLLWEDCSFLKAEIGKWNSFGLSAQEGSATAVTGADASGAPGDRGQESLVAASHSPVPAGELHCKLNVLRLYKLSVIHPQPEITMRTALGKSDCF